MLILHGVVRNQYACPIGKEGLAGMGGDEPETSTRPGPDSCASTCSSWRLSPRILSAQYSDPTCLRMIRIRHFLTLDRWIMRTRAFLGSPNLGMIQIRVVFAKTDFQISQIDN